jgi:hypothetical protein
MGWLSAPAAIVLQTCNYRMFRALKNYRIGPLVFLQMQSAKEKSNGVFYTRGTQMKSQYLDWKKVSTDFSECALVFSRPVIRVARWFLFKPRIQIWANFGGP